MQAVPFQARGHRISCELLNYTRDLPAHGFTNKEVAYITGLGRNTVKDIDLERLQEKYTVDGERLIQPERQARFLGIDEFKLHDGHKYAVVIIDMETGHILWLAHGKKKATVYSFIEHVGKEWMKGVDAVACDMNSDFQEAFEEKCPHIQVVFDYFHPDANLDSRRISDMLGHIGDEGVCRDFFKEYIKLLAKKDEGANILIDSTGLPNSIHFPLTAISNHNGKISNEMRLIYVLQQETELPLFMRYCPGNVVDVSTLTKTILELKANGIQTKFAILDAGYLTKENMEELFENGISFLSRLKENTSLYKDVLSEHLATLQAKENLVSYNSRYAYIKRVDCRTGKDHRVYVYLCQDLSMKNIENSKLFDKAEKSGMKTSQVFDAMACHGIFMLVSSRPIDKEKVLGTYYTRQQIEQVFDICKNYTNMLPLRVQTEQTLRGHLMLSFIAAVIVKMLQKKIKGTSYSPIDVFTILRNHKCKVFDDCLLTQESVKKANEIYKLMDLKVPHLISINQDTV
jgi:hypothetical protein